MPATITHIVSRKSATPERWQQALSRAIANGVKVFQVAGSGEHVATSASEPGTVYRTDGVSCECAAAVLGNDPVCCHRAAFWLHVGVLDPEPPTTPAAPAVVEVPAQPPICPHCQGEEEIEYWVEAAGDYAVTACVCVAPDPFDPEELARIEQAEAAMAAILAKQPPACETCDGSGWDRMSYGGHVDEWYSVRCGSCGGSGAGRTAVWFAPRRCRVGGIGRR